MAMDRNGNCHCSWCGGDLPLERAHLETCSASCAASLASDALRRAIAAGVPAKPQKPRPQRRCKECRMPAQPGRSRCKRHLARQREYDKRRKKQRALCASCAQPAVLGCLYCKEHLAMWRKRYDQLMRQYQEAERRAWTR